MRKRDKLGLALPPVLLRLLLAGTFLWAGLGKIRSEEPVSAEQAAILANMGVIKPPEAAATPDPGTPTAPLPNSGPAIKKDEKVPPKDGTQGGTGDERLKRDEPGITFAAYQPVAPSPGAPQKPEEPKTPPSATPGPSYTAKDFPGQMTTLRVNKLALMMYAGAHPEVRGDGTHAPAFWPASLAGGRVAIVLAWCVAIAQVGGAAMLFIGLLTRFWSLILAGVMAGAIWLTAIGPAISSGHAILGFLPNYPAFGLVEWMPLFWQTALLICSLALALSGPGLLAVDNALFGRDKKIEDDDRE